jgi:DNA gyrase subunit A
MPLFPDLFLRDSHFGNSVLKTARKIGEVTGINLVDEASELMVISQFGKIIRIDTKSIRAAGRSTQGVKLLDLEPPGQSSRRSYSPEEPKRQPEEGTSLQ